MRFVVIQGVVLNTESIDMIVPQGAQSEVSLRNGSSRLFNLSVEELLQHLRRDEDDVLRVEHDPVHPVAVGASKDLEESA